MLDVRLFGVVDNGSAVLVSFAGCVVSLETPVSYLLSRGGPPPRWARQCLADSTSPYCWLLCCDRRTVTAFSGRGDGVCAVRVPCYKEVPSAQIHS
jgi:hypothetical protein